MPIAHRILERALYGIPIPASSDSSSSESHSTPGPASTTVLVPLVISVTLIALGLGLGIFCFVGHRRRQRVWWTDFERRRALREKEDEEVGGGPGMWEIEISDEKESVEHDESASVKGDRQDANVDGWTATVWLLPFPSIHLGLGLMYSPLPSHIVEKPLTHPHLPCNH